MNEWDLKLGNYILSKKKNKGFLSCITKAERGYGKSMYNLKVMAYVFNRLGYSIEESWDKALDSIIFTPSQFMNHIDYNIENDIISPIWCIDDATVHFSSYLYFINVYQTSLLNAAFDTIRTVVSGLLINCPDKSRLLPGLRHYDDFEVTIYMDRGYERKAVGIKWYSLPDGKRRFRKMFEDHFSCFVPDEYYNRYMDLRKKYLKDINDNLRELRDKLEKKKTSE